MEILKHFLRDGVFDAQNPVTIPLGKLIRKLGVLSAAELMKIEVAVRLWLDLK